MKRAGMVLRNGTVPEVARMAYARHYRGVRWYQQAVTGLLIRLLNLDGVIIMHLANMEAGLVRIISGL